MPGTVHYNGDVDDQVPLVQQEERGIEKSPSEFIEKDEAATATSSFFVKV